jgi:hypothetical protein
MVSSKRLCPEDAMPAITQHCITADTPLGANPIGGGATYRAWAPKATAVYLKLNTPAAAFPPGPARLLGQDAALRDRRLRRRPP